MTRVPRPATPVTLAALERRFPGWSVTYDDLHRVWTAERRTGSTLRLLVAYQPAELADKIEQAAD